MGVSTVSFGRLAFEANDSVLEVLLRLMVEDVDSRSEVPTWLREARDDWQLLATEEFGFGAAPDFDDVVTDEVRRQVMFGICSRVAGRILSFGDPIRADLLNSLGAGREESAFTRDVSASLFLETANRLVGLFADVAGNGNP